MRVTIVNLFYPPGLAPSGHFAASVADHRAALGDDVTVVCGTGGYLGGTEREGRSPGPASGPRVLRLWTPALGKANTARRLGDYVTFLVSAVARLLFLPKQDVVIALTSPPYIVAAAVAHRLLHPRTRVVLWSHDVYPDAAEAYGTIRTGGVLSRVLRSVKRWLLRRVDHVVAVDPAMLHRVLAGYARDGAPDGSVIPTWEPMALFPGKDQRPKRWSAYDDPDLVGRFIVLHLGNLGFGHRTDTIADAAASLADEGVTFLFVGGGARFPELAEEARRRDVENVRFRGYVPKEQTPSVLAGADCTLISLDDRSIGIMSPCKMNASLAMGVPVIYSGPEGTNVDEAIARYRCGYSLRQGDVSGLADAIRLLRVDRVLASELSRNARRAFEETYSDLSALPRFDALLENLTSSGRRSVAG
ncbi:MAG TPA: glycosyltransferase family 4 protein [Actinomycetota bacterium]|nr:glycosyltransferase family 4 protein [Actinomycetota bacterium]